MSQQFQIGDYRETYRNFRLDVPDRFNWAYDVFDHWGRQPQKVAMVWVGQDGRSREITFAEFGQRSRRVANALAGLGTVPGDRVFIMLPRLVEWWELTLGCIRGRFVPVPGTPLLTTKDIEYRLNAAKVTIAVTDEQNVEKFEAVRAECTSLRQVVVIGKAKGWHAYEDILAFASPELPHPHNLSSDPLVIYFTSGTTG